MMVKVGDDTAEQIWSFTEIDDDGVIDLGGGKVRIHAGELDGYQYANLQDDEALIPGTNVDCFDSAWVEKVQNRLIAHLSGHVTTKQNTDVPLTDEELRNITIFGPGDTVVAGAVIEEERLIVTLSIPDGRVFNATPDRVAALLQFRDALLSLATLNACYDRILKDPTELSLGVLLAKLDNFQTAARVRRAIPVEKARRLGGERTARSNKEEKRLIVTARESLSRTKDRPKSWAATKIAAQLRTGTFPGIDRAIDYSVKYVANLRA